MTKTARRPRGQVIDRRDQLGLSLFAAAVIWTFVAANAGGDPWPVVGMYALSGTAYLVGRLSPPGLVPALVVTVAVGLGFLSLAGFLPEGADAAPLGYVNAQSAFYVEAAAAAVMIGLLARRRAWRVVWVGIGAIFALVPLVNRSEAASFVVILLLLPAATLALEARRLAAAMGLSVVLLVATLGVTVLVAAAPGSSDTVRLAGQVVGERRVVLWREALDILADDSLMGSGPGRFAVESPTARTDQDARWAHHGFLQQGAEAGLVGMALLLLLFLWAFWRLSGAGPPSGITVMGSFVLGGLGIMACSDYILHFPLISGLASGVVGSAVSFARRTAATVGGASASLKKGSRLGVSRMTHSLPAGSRADRPMRVLYLIDSLGDGGSERSLAELLSPLSASGIRPMVATLHRRNGVEREVVEAGIDVRFLDSKSRLHRIRVVRELLESERPDILHTTLFESDIAGRMGAVRLGVPVVSSLVNTSYDPARLQDPNVRASRLWMARMIDSWSARHLTAHFHAVSRAVKESAVRDLRIPAERITVIERGRDPARLGAPDPVRRERARRRLGFSRRDEVLVTVGRQEFQKGQRYLIEAMAELSRIRPNTTLLIAGRRGHASEELERVWRETGLGDRVRFLGFTQDVPEILAAADLFVFPSLYEGLPGALIEAMAAGLPVVASDIDATREVLEPGRNALLVPPASASHLAGGILRLLCEENERRRFGSRSRAIFEERFTLQGSVLRTVALYERVLQGTNGGTE
jgi:glycosyltransferase involved in cell wall biosynthesis/O-antigen ligase